MNTPREEEIAEEAWEQIRCLTYGSESYVKEVKQIIQTATDKATKEFANDLIALLTERSKGEVNTWGFVAAFIDMIKQVRNATLKP